ncbi:MAG: methionine gamma-lyase family protein [Firmicutes bacterium]|nr:methionine gamma-lyase family protein [Bacillota bacterium]
MVYSDELMRLAATAEIKAKKQFEEIDERAFKNQVKVMNAFRDNKIKAEHFASTSGYGYNDAGREAIEALYASVFECQAALVRHSIVSGTQALTIGLFGLLRPGDTLLCVTGKPYDTLEEVIGLQGQPGNGSLKDFGVNYRETSLTEDGRFDTDAIISAIDDTTKVIYIQKSRGYCNRPTLRNEDIGALVKAVKAEKSDLFVMVDNCYGEFCELHEPTYYGADLAVGSLIKNPGGGMAESGGYLAGSKRAVELCAYRLTAPGIGGETGATLGQNKSIIKGLFYAPHTTAQALKTAVFAASLFEEMQLDSSPRSDETRYDIIQTLTFSDEQPLISFCEGIQSGSPIDSFVTPVPWDMPGYQDEVIMAAGTFTQGASIELSADAPIRAPFTVYIQGGLTYESGKIGIISAAQRVLDQRSGK